MKNRLLFFLFVLLICIFPTYIKAEEYNTYSRVDISTVITTGADVSDISKINVVCRIYTAPETYNQETIVLTKGNNFKLSINYDELYDFDILYGYVETSSGVIDKYGFVSIEPKKDMNIPNKLINFILNVKFSDMGFDGKNYRRNTEIDDEIINERKDGVVANDSKIITTTSPVYTTTQFTESTNKIITESSNISNNVNNDNTSGFKDSVKVLEYVIVVTIILITVVGIFVLYKYNASKKMV